MKAVTSPLVVWILSGVILFGAVSRVHGFGEPPRLHVGDTQRVSGQIGDCYVARVDAFGWDWQVAAPATDTKPAFDGPLTVTQIDHDRESPHLLGEVQLADGSTLQAEGQPHGSFWQAGCRIAR